LNPDEVVAMGASVQANVLSGELSGILLLDVIPLSLGLETMGGIVSKIIHRNSTIPISASQGFTTYADGQTSVEMHVLQGERELVRDNRSLGRFQLKGLPPMPAGLPKIEVEFIVDANGILSVRAMEMRTAKAASIVVNPSHGLNDAEVEKMLGEAFGYAEADFGVRFLIEARNAADTLIRATRKSLERGSGLVTPEAVANINEARSALELSLASSDSKKIKSLIDKFNEATQNLAERILNQAVKEALEGKSL
jgi:molecular chaperone DnaK (HSP70)